jgi:hypothetical protein
MLWRRRAEESQRIRGDGAQLAMKKTNDGGPGEIIKPHGITKAHGADANASGRDSTYIGPVMTTWSMDRKQT